MDMEHSSNFSLEHRTRAWLENSPVCTKVIDLDFNLQYMSCAGAEALGIEDISEFYGKPYPFDFYPDSFKIPMSDNLQRVKETGKIMTQEASVVDVYGGELWFQSTVLPVNDDEGKIDYLMVISIDITDLKQVESKLRTKERVFDTSIAANSIADPKGIITEVNAAFLQIWGFANKDEVLGKHVSYFLESEKMAAEIIDTLDRKDVWEGDYIAKKQDGSIFPAHSLATVLRDNDGELVGYQSSVSDITDLRSNEEILKKNMEILRASSEQLRKSNESLEEFAYVASHDMQEPLRVVASYCQLLKEKYYDDLDAEGQKYIDYSVDSAMRMRTLIRELLDFSRVGRLDQPFEYVKVEEIIQEALSDYQMVIDDSNAKIIIEDDMPSASVVRFRFKQLMSNIISNSLKFRSEKSPEIRIGCCDDGAAWLFYVKDNGIGINSQYLDRIFGIFKRLYSRDEYPGTGIGLALCKRIVETHGGKIWVESEEDKGTCIYFTISKKNGYPEVISI
jgi:PAS domain S-box-containing protein